MRANYQNIQSNRRHRGGYVYVAVLFTALIVGASVAAALSLSTNSLHSESDHIDRMRALRLAESEVSRVAAILNADAAWRTNFSSGVFEEWNIMNLTGDSTVDSQVRFMLTDNDGDLSDDETDSVVLTTHAKVGNSEFALEATLEPTLGADDILLFGVTASDDIQIESDGSLSSERKVQAGDDCKTASSGIISAPRIEYTDVATLTLRGDVASANVSLPTHDVLDQYVDAGTQISIASLPVQNSKRVISDQVLSVTSNPFGSADADGIYWIDAGNGIVRIVNSHIRATLAIKNASSVEVAGGVVWTYPSAPDVFLVTDSQVHFTGLESTLDESQRGQNFNPSSVPYRGTEADSDQTDIFATEFRGILYSTARVQVDPFLDGGTIPFVGNLICTDFEIYGASVAVRELIDSGDSAPLGLKNMVPLQFVRGSFRRVPSP